MTTAANDRELAVSVIVPHYRQPDALRLCLESLERQTMPQDDYEVIVVDNGSDLDLTDIENVHPSFRFLTESEKGAACARNKGMAAACGRAFAFIDADCVAEPDWLNEGLLALSSADLVGGEVVVTQAAQQPTPVEAFERIFAFRQRMYIGRKRFSVTANLFSTRAAAAAIGPFHNGVSEDVDWCRRGLALGFHLAFNDTSIISHPARRTWNELTQKWDRTIRERWNGFGGRGIARRLLWAALAAATALSAAPHLASIVFSDRVRGARAKAAAAGVLARIRLWRAWRMMTLLRSA
jgi:glycosyltransferase involved in cell wall biosynthesis